MALIRDICSRCLEQGNEENSMLRELAHSRNKSTQDLLREMKYGRHSSMREQANEHAQERQKMAKEQLQDYEERLRQYEEELSMKAMESMLQGDDVDELAMQIQSDNMRRDLEEAVRALRSQPEGLSQEDLEKTLEDLVRQGLIDMDGDRVKITSRGARRLANQVLNRILANLAQRDMGPHSMDETGYGSQRSNNSRKYEFGDDYANVNIEKTLLNAMERKDWEMGQFMEYEDFHVWELVHQTRLCAGLIIDESGSMHGEKVEAAIDASLALAEIMGKDPKDSLRVFLFSDRVREIPRWDIVNANFSGGTTDIRASLKSFRQAVRNEQGDKQAYIITDTEPNTQDGRYIGFEAAAPGVMEEVMRCKQEGITINIIMLDQRDELKMLASSLAKKGVGRVFHSSPQNLVEVVVEDYLRTKKKRV
ncbi:MAG: hypothetical protein QGG56_06690 [Dehalococcoidia bacterium]|nr:hypothetical protein [Dehalococcoidia bacterium]